MGDFLQNGCVGNMLGRKTAPVKVNDDLLPVNKPRCVLGK